MKYVVRPSLKRTHASHLHILVVTHACSWMRFSLGLSTTLILIETIFDQQPIATPPWASSWHVWTNIDRFYHLTFLSYQSWLASQGNWPSSWHIIERSNATVTLVTGPQCKGWILDTAAPTRYINNVMYNRFTKQRKHCDQQKLLSEHKWVVISSYLVEECIVFQLGKFESGKRTKLWGAWNLI